MRLNVLRQIKYNLQTSFYCILKNMNCTNKISYQDNFSDALYQITFSRLSSGEITELKNSLHKYVTCIYFTLDFSILFGLFFLIDNILTQTDCGCLMRLSVCGYVCLIAWPCEISSNLENNKPRVMKSVTFRSTF